MARPAAAQHITVFQAFRALGLCCAPCDGCGGKSDAPGPGEKLDMIQVIGFDEDAARRGSRDSNQCVYTDESWTDVPVLTGEASSDHRADGQTPLATQLEERPPVKKEDGSVYTGQWLGNEYHGRGRRVSPSGAVYEGQWQRNMAHGVGKITNPDGSTYDGEWVQSHRSGDGVEQWSDGSRFEGQFQLSRKHGIGIYRSSIGQIVYKGSFRNDSMHGHGSFMFANGRTYIGEWSAGNMHGTGIMTFLDGTKHCGGYRENKRHGDGLLTRPCGASYRGQFRDGKLHGVGTRIDADGTEFRGEWRDGSRVTDVATKDAPVDDPKTERAAVTPARCQAEK